MYCSIIQVSYKGTSTVISFLLVWLGFLLPSLKVERSESFGLFLPTVIGGQLPWLIPLTDKAF